MRHFHDRRNWFRHPGSQPGEENKRRYLFRRFFWFLGPAMLLFLLALIGGLAYLFTRLFGGSGQVPMLVWLATCGLALAIPGAAGFAAIRSFNRFVNPLARVMAAADAVAEGDFSVRVPEVGPGEFARLAQSFNRMVSNLEETEKQRRSLMGDLERTDRLRRSLAADVAHELRTPLHVIQGNLEGILDGVYQPTPEQIDLLLDETHQLARLVEDLRTLSLAEAGQLALKRESVDVPDLLDDVATSFSGQAEGAGVALRAESTTAVAGAPGLSVEGDAGRLDQVLSNLVSNALRHTPPGGRVTLSAEAIQDGVRIRVADTGSGIPPEDLPSIFERFWRGEGSRLGGGSGLGLAIARQLVQAHGGSIRVESKVGEGTTFTIELPEKKN